MDAYQARSGVCRSGVTHAGNITRRLAVTMGGTDVACHLADAVGLTMTHALSGGLSEAIFRVRTVEPLEGHTFVVTMGLVPIWGGTVMARQATHLEDVAFVGYDVHAVDWRWLLDRYAPVSGIYHGQGINAIVADILARFVDPASGFTAGEIPASLGNVDYIEFSDTLVSEALTRLAQASKATALGMAPHWRIRPDKAVDLAIEFSHTAVVLDNATCYEQLTSERTASQIRNQVRILAGGSELAVNASIGATELLVRNGLKFNPAGGVVRVAGNTVTYTSVVNASTETGTLLGCAGVAHGCAVAAAVQPLVVVNDLMAQADAASRLGGGQSGVIFVTRVNGDLSYAEAEGAALSEIAIFSRMIQGVAYSLTTPAAREFGVGRILDAAITLPGRDPAHPAEVIDGAFQIQEVSISTITSTVLVGDEPRFRWSLVARRARRANWYDLIAQTAQEAVR